MFIISGELRKVRSWTIYSGLTSNTPPLYWDFSVVPEQFSWNKNNPFAKDTLRIQLHVMQTLLTSHRTSKSHYLVLVRTYIPALRPPMLIHKVKSFFHCLELFTAFHITFLSWVRSTALPLPTEHTLAISSRALGYSFQFSCLEPLLFPKGKSEMNTSMLLAFKGRLHTSHWKISRGRVFLH